MRPGMADPREFASFSVDLQSPFALRFLWTRVARVINFRVPLSLAVIERGRDGG